MRRALTRLIALWPLLLAIGWFASTARLAGHLHSAHERAAHLDDARGDWAGDCEFCRGAIGGATAPAPQTGVATVAGVFRAIFAPPDRLVAPAFADFPPLAARPPPAAS